MYGNRVFNFASLVVSNSTYTNSAGWILKYSFDSTDCFLSPDDDSVWGPCSITVAGDDFRVIISHVLDIIYAPNGNRTIVIISNREMLIQNSPNHQPTNTNQIILAQTGAIEINLILAA